MLADIFSSLDFYYVSEVWGYLITGISYLSFASGVLSFYPKDGGFWLMPSSFCHILASMTSVIFQIFVDSKGYRFGGLGLGCVSGFWVLILLNFGGMIPGGCSVTTQLSVGLSLSLIWWFWPVLSGFCYNWKEFLAHLLPLGTPFILCPLMVLIESVSVLIRPITLAVRLVANITMGHLVLALMGDKLIGKTSVIVGAYVMFEFFVCGLQAYVFILLVSLYSAEHPGSQ
uniref:ATP synthase subunit a n=1 Tax=Microcondylaea bonellii TaxID=1678567 RepID=A0A513X0E2_9BIVA|nr:ATP synthase F0 subunit 6 [Microcondylaea bonellii]